MTRRLALCLGLLTSLGLCLPAGTIRAQTPAPALEIVAATYGVFEDAKPVAGKTITVTSAVSRVVKDGRVRLEVGNDPFGDPASGEGKKLEVRYTLDGKPATITVNEGETLLIPAPKLTGKLTIRKATYGDHSQGVTADVTDLVKARLHDGKVEVPVDNTFLGDPAEGVFKQLRVEYVIGDVELVKRTYEGGTLVITEPSAESKTEAATPTK
jgi:hypothetical protein